MGRLVVDAKSNRLSLNLRELAQYKDLFWVLAYRDLRVRYAQTFLGFLWAFIQPAATILILTLVFGKALKIDTGGVPYPLFAVCGMVGWTYFAFVMQQSGQSIIASQQMIKKIYFPRLVIPLSKALVGLVDFGVTILLLLLMVFWYSYYPSPNIIWLPLFVMLIIIYSLSVGILLSALSIRYRDIQHIIPFMAQIGLYLTPVAYPAEFIIKAIPPWLSVIYFLNPMAGIVEGLRWSLLGTSIPTIYYLYSFLMAILLFIGSLFYFKKVEREMADIV